MFRGDKTCISRLFVKHCEPTDHHPTRQRHLQKVEVIEVLHCNTAHYKLVNECVHYMRQGRLRIREINSDTNTVFVDILIDQQ